MMNLTSASDLIRVVTGSAAQIECHASWVDVVGGAGTLGRWNTPVITTATTTTIVPAPASGARNVKHLNITNDHPSASCVVTVEHTDGTTVVELMAFVLLPGENMIFNEEGRWAHRDRNGAEYPPAGLGAFNGYGVPFMKTTSTPEAVGTWYCTSKDAGFPGAWSPGAPGINGRVCSGITGADAGAIPVRNPSVGANFLTEINLAASLNHTHLFFDTLWVNTGLAVTTTTPQAIAMPALPARDVNGTTNGEGCMIGMLVTASTTNAAVISNTTVTYTNSAGVANRTATLTAINGSQIPATALIGTLIWFNLQAGDVGVQSIQAVTLNTSLGAGSISMIIARDVAQMGTALPNVAASKAMPNPGVRMYNDQTMLHCMLCGTATATFMSGELVVQEK
jgi:hypothetical protein